MFFWTERKQNGLGLWVCNLIPNKYDITCEQLKEKEENMAKACMEALFLVTQTGWNQHETLLIGKRDEAQWQLKANKSTLHTCICCFSHGHALMHTDIQQARKQGGPLCLRPPTQYPEPCAALCASFELSNIQVKTGKCIYVLCVRNQHWWMTWPVESWWSGDRAPLMNRLQGFTPLCAINKRCSSSLFPCHR